MEVALINLEESREELLLSFYICIVGGTERRYDSPQRNGHWRVPHAIAAELYGDWRIPYAIAAELYGHRWIPHAVAPKLDCIRP